MIQWKIILDLAKSAKKYVIHCAPQAKHYLVKNAPKILTGLGIVSMTGATIHAISTSPKAKEEIQSIENDPDLSHREYILKKTRTLAYFYWPEVLMVFGGAGLIIGGQKISLGRLATTTALLSSKIAENKELKEKIKQSFGEKELNKIQDSIAQDKVTSEVRKQSVSGLGTIYNTGHGTTLCYEAIGGKFFWSDLEFIRRTTDELNEEAARMMQCGKVSAYSLNDWYEAQGLPKLDGKFEGREMGPNIGKDIGWRNRFIKLRCTSGLLENDQTYMVIGFTDEGAPELSPDIADSYYDDYASDDETDMRWRGR